MSLLQPEMQRMKLRNHESVTAADTATLSRLLTKNSMCDREDDKDAEQVPEEIGDETVRRSLLNGFTKSQGKTTILLSRTDTALRQFGG